MQNYFFISKIIANIASKIWKQYIWNYYIQITLNLKGYGETKLFVLPLDNKTEGTESNSKDFVLVYCEDDIANPFMTLQLTEENIFKIVSQREVEETEDDLRDKLNDLAIRVVESIQMGIDLSAVSLSKRALEKPYNPDQIRVESKTFSIRLIYDMNKPWKKKKR